MPPDQTRALAANGITDTSPLACLSWMPRSGAPPRQLVVLCHGMANDASQMAGLALHWGKALPDAVFLAPHAPLPHRSRRLALLLRSPAKRDWFSLAAGSTALQESGVRLAAAMLNQFVDQQAAHLAVPASAIALAGFSQGAMVALFAGLRRKVAPAGIVAFAGALMAPQTLAAELQSRAPVLLMPGSEDRVVPPAASLAALRVLSECGVPARLDPMADVAHDITLAGMNASAGFLLEAFG